MRLLSPRPRTGWFVGRLVAIRSFNVWLPGATSYPHFSVFRVKHAVAFTFAASVATYVWIHTIEGAEKSIVFYVHQHL